MHKFPANTLFTGKTFINVPSCHSTNAHASALMADTGLNEGAIVSTPNQVAGRGQRGNGWEAEPHKNFTFSWILKPAFLEISQQFWLNAVVSLGIADFLGEYVSHGIKIKWPNDIYYFDDKLGGILIENSIRSAQIESSIVGIGLNINQTNFATKRAISLHTICAQPFDLNELLLTLLPALEKRYLQLKNEGLKQIQKDYFNALYWMGQEHIFKTHELVKGTIVDVDETGHLLIEISSKVRRFSFKEVEFVE